MSDWIAAWVACASNDESPSAKRAFKLTVDRESTRARAMSEEVFIVTKANGARGSRVIRSLRRSLVTREVPVRMHVGQRRPPAAPPSRGQSYFFFFADFFAVFLAAFFLAGILVTSLPQLVIGASSAQNSRRCLPVLRPA